MAQDFPDTEIRDSFLTEAGEIVENLGGQLMELEKEPGDPDLLNAVFRAFHTVKGGAGFLDLTAIVHVCHHAEDLLNVARNGKVLLDSGHTDALLQTLDIVQRQMQALRGGEEIESAPSDLIDRLKPTAAVKAQEPIVVKPTTTGSSDIGDDEFEKLLDNLYGQSGAPGVTVAATHPSGDVTDEEFEALLDQIHGTGGSPGSKPAVASALLAPREQVPAPVPAPKPAKEKPATASAPETTVRVDTARLDGLVNHAGELVLVRNRLQTLLGQSDDVKIQQALSELDRVSDGMQDSVLGMRMQPVGKLFSRFPRIVRDLSKQLEKEVELVLEGEDTNLDRSLVEGLADPLVHLIRNALDHGLERPSERVNVGKERKGRVTLGASQRGERIIITVEDDGRGMNPEVLRRKAVEKGVIDEAQAARMSDNESYELIFRPGFSTAATVSEISGRGVGMDVVKTRIVELGGTLQVHSRLGHGSKLELAVPLTMAIQSVLMVRSGKRLLALPLVNVHEVFELQPDQTQNLDGMSVANHRGRALPLANIAGWLRLGIQPGRHVVVIQIGHTRLGCLVHEVLGREDVMVKPLGQLFEGVPAIAGATVTGGGLLALVIDLSGLTGQDGQLISSLRVTS